MVTPEELRVLRLLRRRGVTTGAELAAGGFWRGWGFRVLANLEWLGLVAVFYDGAGEPAVLELTDRGSAFLKGCAGTP